jgi:acetyl-CoA synthetase
MSPCKSRSPDVFRMQIRDIQNHVKKVTAPYKYPRAIEYVESLPKIISNKIRRNDLRDREMKKLSRETGTDKKK